jgi:hypothetical protein
MLMSEYAPEAGNDRQIERRNFWGESAFGDPFVFSETA